MFVSLFLSRALIYSLTLPIVFSFLYPRRTSREISPEQFLKNNEEEPHHGCLPFITNPPITTIPPTILYKTFEVERLDAPIEKIGMEVLEEDLNATESKNLDDFAIEISQMKDSSEIEECMENRDKLPEEVIRRLKNQIQRLSRLIKKLTKQQRQYCVANDQEPVNIIEYRQCPIWREEKIVHYYKLMRMTYCADYNRWPKASRGKRSANFAV